MRSRTFLHVTALVQEICDASARLDAYAKSLLLIVTSRPAAFANSPVFPAEHWTHLELRNLRHTDIQLYRDKWIDAQGLTDHEASQLKATLELKLQQPHLRDLARNPMQLSILLHLLHVQGAALPEKRTALYREYTNLFFNREAEKSPVVRDHRDLLLSIHGMIAWTLHSVAEGSGGSGRMSREDLHQEIRHYLEVQGHDSSLANELLSGAVERLCALVSRVEGTFEFEVQPLREFFAARHLYMTAPYAPVGSGIKGTRPERFRTLARSFYWTNVTRFYCGFHEVGELASLVDEIAELGKSEEWDLIAQPRYLAMMLLSDRVFSQVPMPMERLLAFVTSEPGFQRFLYSAELHRRGDHALPSGAGRERLFEACSEKLEGQEDFAQRRALFRILADNADTSSLQDLLRRRSREGLTGREALWEASLLGIVETFTPTEIQALANNDPMARMDWLVRAGRHGDVMSDPQLMRLAIKATFAGVLGFPLRRRVQSDPVNLLEALTTILRLHALAGLLSIKGQYVAGSAVAGRLRSGSSRMLEQLRDFHVGTLQPALGGFVRELSEGLSQSAGEWQESLNHWDTLVNRGLEVCEGSHLMVEVAALASALRADPRAGSWDDDGFVATRGLVKRLFYARHMVGDQGWWNEALQTARGEGAVPCLAVLLNWGTAELILSLKSEVQELVDALDARGRRSLRSISEVIGRVPRTERPEVSGQHLHDETQLSAEVASLFLHRIADKNVARQFGRRYFANYTGNNPEVIGIAGRIELQESTPSEIDWGHLVELSKRARETGTGIYFPSSPPGQSLVPEVVAKDVLTGCNRHTGQLVALCNQAYSSHLVERTPRVAEVAEGQHWFDPPQ